MAYELVYTSAPSGINRSSSGFCVVACTKGLGPRLVIALEGYSAYKPVYPHYSENAWDNPVSRSHYIFDANGEHQHILSRICFNGVDYTGRSNKLASHLVLSPAEVAKAAGGPAALLLQDELFKDAKWTIQVESYDTQRSIPVIPAHPAKCSAWETATGDAGWGGYLAKNFLANPRRNVFIIYEPQQHNIIPRLFDEAINLLPEERRWGVTFNTYFVTLPAGASCVWRGVLRDSDAARFAKRSPENIVIDLANPGALTDDDALITAARTGVFPEAPRPVRTTRTKVAPEPPRPEIPVPTEMPSEASSPPSEPTKPTVVSVPVAPLRPVPAVADRRNGRRMLLIALPLLACLAAVAAFFAVESIRNNRIYHQASQRCGELHDTVADVEKSHEKVKSELNSAAEESALNRLKDEIDTLQETVKSVLQKADELAVHQALFDDALNSGRLDDQDHTPAGLRERCERQEKELNSTMEQLTRKRKEIRRLKARQQERNLLPPPPPPPKQPAPTAEPKSKPSEVAAPADSAPPVPPPPATAARKKVAPPDKSDFLWRRGEILYKRDAGDKLSVAVGDIPPQNIEIVLLPGSRMSCAPGGELKCTNSDDNDVILKTAYDAETGTLTIAVSKYRLSRNQFILVRTRDSGGEVKHYPLFFDSKRSEPELKPGRYSFKAAEANVSLNLVLHVKMPDYVYDEDSRLCWDAAKILKFELHYGDGFRLPMQRDRLDPARLIAAGSRKDETLEQLLRQERQLTALKAQFESGKKVDTNNGREQLPQEVKDSLEEGAKADEDVKNLAPEIRKQLLSRYANSKGLKAAGEKIDALREWMESNEGKKRLKNLPPKSARKIDEFKELYEKRNAFLEKLGKSIRSCREEREKREESLRKYYADSKLVISDSKGVKIKEINMQFQNASR